MNIKLVVAGLGLACLLGMPAMAVSEEVPCSAVALRIASGYGQEVVEAGVASSYSYYCLASEVRTIDAFNTLIEQFLTGSKYKCVSNTNNIYVQTWMAQVFDCYVDKVGLSLSVMVDRVDGEIIMMFFYALEEGSDMSEPFGPPYLGGGAQPIYYMNGV